jgi:tetratricopeptide (TPR) repeat protein
MAASVVVFFVLGRLRFPLVPILILFAAAGIDALPKLREGGARRIAACAGCLLFGALFANVGVSGGVVDPRAHTWNDIGVELRRSGRTQEALALFEQSIARDASFYRAYLNKGEILRTEGQVEAAIHFVREAVALQPDSSVARQYLAAALKDAGRLPEALSEIRRAIEIDPAHVPFRSMLGLLLLQQGHAAEAVPHLLRYAEERPEDPKGHNNLGAALSRAGRTEEARAAFQRALRLDPSHHGARVNLESLPGG